MSENNRHELIVGGTGGQGVITIGYALAAAASETCQYVTRFPVYMATMRGGPAYCTVIFSDQEIAAPILSRADNAIAMEKGAYGRLKNEVKPGGKFVINSSIIDKAAPTEDFETVGVPVTELALEMGKPQMANMIMLGAYREITGVLTEEQVLGAMKKDLAKEGKESRFDLTKEAFSKGAEYVRNQ